jgi:N-acetylglucosaminyldiphosphoundecaprenol N-acetyl-beta-D-mannosaminyltransferase
MRELPTVHVLGVRIHGISRSDLLPVVWELLDREQPSTIAYANVHVLNTAHNDDWLRTFLNGADLCFCDGNGVRLGASILGQYLPERMTGADWIWDLAREAEGRLRIYWIGGHPGATKRAAAALVARYGKLTIETDHGFHTRTGLEDEECIARINGYDPDIVLVGMGTPIQERWVEQRRHRIRAKVVWCLGATADFVAGDLRRGPSWLNQHAEWLSRLVIEPRRLWRRYLLGNTAFVARVLWARVRAGTAGNHGTGKNAD